LDEDWETVDNKIDKLKIDDEGLLAQQISKSRDY